MLPSCGYFRTVICPFYSNGLCERPHCHFRHEQPQTSAVNLVHKLNLPLPLEELSNDVTSRDLLHHLQQAIKKVQEDVKRNEEELAGISSATQTHSASVVGDSIGPVTYIPTPVSKSSSVKPAVTSDAMTNSGIPEYKPTPISKLKKMHKCMNSETEKSRDSLEYDPLASFKIPEPAPKVKRKRTEEYDPTLVKCKPTYSVPLEIDSDDDCMIEKKPKLDTDAYFDNKANSVSASKKNDTSVQFSDDESFSNSAQESVEKSSDLELDKDAAEQANDLPMNQFDLVQHIMIQSNQSVGKLKGVTKDVAKSKVAASKTSIAKDGQKKSNSTSPKAASHQKKDHKTNAIKKDKNTKHTSSHSKQSHTKSKQSKDHSTNDKKHSKISSNEKSKTTHKKLDSSSKSSQDHKAHKNCNVQHSVDKEKKVKVDKEKSSNESIHKSHKMIDSKTKQKSKDLHSASKHISKTSSSSSSPRSVKDKEERHNSSKQKSSSSSKSSNRDLKKKSDAKKKDAVTKGNKPDVENFKVPDSARWLSTKTNSSPFKNSDSSAVESGSDDDDDIGGTSDYGYSLLDLDDIDTDLDEHDTYEECLRIFNESVAAEDSEKDASLSKAEKLQKSAQNAVEIPVLPGKKRIAYESANTIKRPLKVSRVSQVQLINNRLQQVQEVYNKQKEAILKKTPNPFANSATTGKRRIAHVPNAALVAAAAQRTKLGLANKAAATSSNNSSISSPPITSQVTPTIATTIGKGERRIAHVPNISNRPMILAEYGSKVPTMVRQRYLNSFVNECLKLYPEEEDAFKRAIEEEKSVYVRSTTKTVYLNLAVNAIKRLRNEAGNLQVSVNSSDIKPSTSRQRESPLSNSRPQPIKVSHEYILAGPKAANIGYNIDRHKVKKEVDVSGAKLYQMLKPYILAQEQLEENGFPLPHPSEPGKAIINNLEVKKPSLGDSLSRICSRCGKKYRVTIKGLYLVQEECIYHWGRPWKKRIAGSWETRYSCCQGDLESDGCCVGMGHVFDGNESDILKGFVKTLPKTPPIDGNYGVYSLDCEMCYTTAGVELTRITVINSNLKPVFESLVKPENPILDYNTRFSGITEEDLYRVKTTIRDVQAVLLSLFNDKTILIGHSLESDFKALKLIHPTVVDTSIVFPHKRGPPFKRALKTLMGEYLNKIIQNSVDGHDSQEDAVACMELMLWKIRDDIKRINR